MGRTMPEPEEEYDIISVSVAEPNYGIQIGNGVLVTHAPSACENDPACCIHKPSDHPLNTAKMNWRSDTGVMERICSHGVGHPDPDDIAHKKRTMGKRAAWGYSVHGCDGCCRG